MSSTTLTGLCLRAPISGGTRLGVDPLRHPLHIPRETDHLHQPDDVPGRVEFPPVEPVARGALIAVMVVVPALADGKEGGERVVARFVDRVEPARPEQVVHGVDGERGVRERDCRQAESPDEPRQAADQVHRHRQQQRRHEEVRAQEADFPELREVADHRVGRLERVVLRVVQEPADVRVVDAADHRAVRIAVAIGEAMMVHVMARPPQRSLLHRGRADERPHETGHPVHLERAMREVAVERQREADRAQEVRERPQRHEAGRERHRKHEERRCLDDPEHYLRENDHRRLNLSAAERSRIGKPANAGRSQR